MVLNMADLGKCRKSFQTPWNVSYFLENRFLTTFELVGEDLGWIRKGPKSTDFEQKAWVIALGFEDADLGRFRKSFQTPWNAFYFLENRFLTTFEIVREDLGWIRKGPKSTDFEQKAWAIAHGFEHGGFGQVSEIVPNSLKRLLFSWK